MMPTTCIPRSLAPTSVPLMPMPQIKTWNLPFTLPFLVAIPVLFPCPCFSNLGNGGSQGYTGVLHSLCHFFSARWVFLGGKDIIETFPVINEEMETACVGQKEQ
eukprot:scaffold163639_cov18-Tisochrysis_lutea.AAC.1